MPVRIGSYPIFPTPLMSADQGLIDQLAAEYTSSLGGAEPEMSRFLFGHVPVWVFDRIFAGDDVPVASLNWLLQLSGYFGGRWLRGEIEKAQPDAMLNLVDITPAAEKFAATMDRAGKGIAASRADDGAVLDYAVWCMHDEPSGVEGVPALQGLTDNFGYNKGYMLEILAAPPAGLTSGPEYQVSGVGLFDCTYASPRLAVLATLADVQSALVRAEGVYADIVRELKPIQDLAEPRGRSVWSTGLSVQGFPQREYDQLLDVSSSFLETVQATALTMVKARVERDATLARRGAIANAGMIIWLAAYMDGLLHGAGAKVLPEFTR
jgi:hypothetical protein